MYKQGFRYFRLIAKSISLPFILVGVFIFILQFLPTYVGSGIWLYVFIGGGFFWAIEPWFVFLDDIRQASQNIAKHRSLTPKR